MAKPSADPGFGIKYGRVTGRLIRPDGTVNLRRVGERFHPSDIYHTMVVVSWWRFFAATIAVYVVVNSFFATLYMAVGTEHIAQAPSADWMQSFETAVFFSAQTLTTVGYGDLAPHGALTNAIASFEALTGLILFGLVTGLSFARFAHIKPRILFSHNAIIAPHRDRLNGFMIRLVNERASYVMDASASVTLSLQDVHGASHNRRYYSLPLDVDSIKTLAMNWTLVHTITPDSPVYGITLQDLIDRNAEVLVILTAFDDTVGQQFYARTSYVPSEFVYGARFEPMFWPNEAGDIELHLEKTHATTPAELFPMTSSDDGSDA